MVNNWTRGAARQIYHRATLINIIGLHPVGLAYSNSAVNILDTCINTALYRFFTWIQWRTQDFRTGGVEVPQAPRVVVSGEGYPLSPLGKGLERGLCPLPQKIFRIFCWKYHILTLTDTLIS